MLERILVTLTPQLLQCLDHVAATSQRNAEIERILRRSRDIRAAAKELGIDLSAVERRGVGRPKGT